MDRPNLILTFSFKDDTPDAVLELYNEDFTFEYGFNSRQDLFDTDLQAVIRCIRENEKIAQKFLFSNYRNLTQSDNLKEINIEIFRPDYEKVYDTFTFKEGTFRNLNFSYINGANEENFFVIIFNFLPFES